jgi:hypothetical protein
MTGDEPGFRVWTEGIEPAATVVGDGPECVMQAGPEELPLATERVPVALAVWIGLGPRPVPDHPAIRLAPGTMAVVIGRRQAHGHGLEPEVATDLQRRLDDGVRHWTIAVQRGGWRRNLEVVEGDGGIWRVRPADEMVELAPTSTTAVMRELIALVATARTESEPARGPMNADQPASPSD